MGRGLGQTALVMAAVAAGIAAVAVFAAGKVMTAATITIGTDSQPSATDGISGGVRRP